MARRISLSPCATGLKKWPWRVNLPAGYTTTGKRQRHFIKTKQEAETFAQSQRIRLDNYGSNADGKPFSVRYDAVSAMLLNEFLKEHRKVEQQRRDFEAALAQHQKQIDALSAALQRVSAQIEVSKRTPQVAENN